MKPQLENATISGTAQVGETLTAAVEPAGATASYKWLFADEEEGDYSEITAANNNAYVLTASEQGKYIKVQATGTGDYGGTVESAATGPVAAQA